MSHMLIMIERKQSTFEAISPAVKIGAGIVNLDHVITKQTLRDVSLSGSSFSYKLIWLINNLTHIMNKRLSVFVNLFVDVSPYIQHRGISWERKA
jgi:hypothetical protein